MEKNDVRKMAERAIVELSEQLDRGMSDGLQQYLQAMSRFRAYSLGNLLLIVMQRPDARHVAGYRTWKALGRQVKRGEHGIAILAPIVRRYSRDNAKKEVEEEGDNPGQTSALKLGIGGFRSAVVFDISQTDGRDLPQFAQARGDPREYLAKLKTCVESERIALEYRVSLGGADGQSSRGRILVRSGMMPAEEFSVLAHELAHQLMHLRGGAADDHATRETEAEAVAYVVCQAVGIDSRNASTDYIRLHRGDKQLLLKSLQRIHRYAVEVIDRVVADGTDETLANGATSEGVTPPVSEMETVMERNSNVDDAGRPVTRGAQVVLEMWRSTPKDDPLRQRSLKQTLEMIDACVAIDLVTGFMPIDQIVGNVLEFVSGQFDVARLRRHAERRLRYHIGNLRAIQRAWPAVTDCDRLDAAFAKLEDTGIICRHDFSCCGSCGNKEIEQEMWAERQAGREVRGYVYYHVQDTRNAVYGDGLYLSYGPMLLNEDAALRAGREVVAALQAEGLEVIWDGLLKHRIRVSLDWKRRLRDVKGFDGP